MTAIKKVTVLGTGVLGSQIAFQSAFHDFTVIAFDINAQIIEHEAGIRKAAQGALPRQGQARHIDRRGFYSYPKK